MEEDDFGQEEAVPVVPVVVIGDVAPTQRHVFSQSLVGGGPRLFISLEEVRVEGSHRAKFTVNEDVVKKLAEEVRSDEKLRIISIAGPLRTGKSFLMNRLFDEVNAFRFALGPTMDPCTKGIWIWVRRIEGRLFILLDTEGLFSTVAHADTDYDNKILALALLLSSTFVWNNTNVIDRIGIERLGFIAEVSRFVRMKSLDDDGDTNVDAAQISSFFPLFWWVIRDQFLEMTAASEDDYLEEQLEQVGRGVRLEGAPAGEVNKTNKVVDGLLTYFPDRKCCCLPQPCATAFLQDVENHPDRIVPEFLTRLDKLCQDIRRETPVMRSKGLDWTGALFGSMAKSFVKSINSDQFVHVDPCFAAAQASANSALIADVVKMYKEGMKAKWEAATPKPMTMGRLLAIHRSVFSPIYHDPFSMRVLIRRPEDYEGVESEDIDLSFTRIPDEESEGEKEVVDLLVNTGDVQVDRVDRWTVDLVKKIEGLRCQPEEAQSYCFKVFIDENKALSRSACLRFLNAKWTVIDDHIENRERYFPREGEDVEIPDLTDADRADPEIMKQKKAAVYYGRLMADRMAVLKEYDDCEDLGDTKVKQVVREEFLKVKEGQALTVKEAISEMCGNIDTIVQKQKEIEVAVIDKQNAEAATDRAKDQLKHMETQHAQRIKDMEEQMILRQKEAEAHLEDQLRIQEQRLQEANEKQLAEMKAETEKVIAHLKKKRAKERERAEAERKRMESRIEQMGKQMTALASRPVQVVGGGCFSSTETIHVQGQEEPIRLDEVKVGDVVSSVDLETGKPIYSEVYWTFNAKKPTRLIELYWSQPVGESTELRSICLTEMHCLFVAPESDTAAISASQTKLAMNVDRGDFIWVVNDQDELECVPVFLKGYRDGVLPMTSIFTMNDSVRLSTGIVASVFEISHRLQHLDTHDMRFLYARNPKMLDSWWFNAWSEFEEVVVYRPLERILRWWYQ